MHLRNNSLEVDDGGFLVENGILCQEELDAVATQNGWQPYYFLDVMRAVINQECGALYDVANTTTNVGLAHHMKHSINVLSTSIGGMIRVKATATGLPKGYKSFLMVLSSIFFAVATVGFTPYFGWWTPVIITFIYHVVRMIIVVRRKMEDPLSNKDLTDLPSEIYCDAIGRQIKAVYDRKIVLSYDLGKGPNSVVRGISE